MFQFIIGSAACLAVSGFSAVLFQTFEWSRRVFGRFSFISVGSLDVYAFRISSL